MSSISVDRVTRSYKIVVKRNNINVVRPKVTYDVHAGGRRGLPGDPATNLVTSVNGKQGIVVLDNTDVGADPSGAAAQALTDAKAYTDQEVGSIDTGVLSVVAGTNVTVDDTDPANPIVSASGGGGGGGQVDSVVAGTGIDVDNVDPENPEVSLDSATQSSLGLADSALQSGDNISELTNDAGYITSAPSSEWGDITGTLSDQTDLQNALDGKANTSSLATVATTGDYDDLTNKPTIPTLPSTIVESIVAGENIVVDNTDPANPVVSSSGGGANMVWEKVFTENELIPTLDAPISTGEILNGYSKLRMEMFIQAPITLNLRMTFNNDRTDEAYKTRQFRNTNSAFASTSDFFQFLGGVEQHHTMQVVPLTAGLRMFTHLVIFDASGVAVDFARLHNSWVNASALSSIQFAAADTRAVHAGSYIRIYEEAGAG